MGTVTLTVRNRWRLSGDDWESFSEDFKELLEELTPVDTGYCQESWEMDVGDDQTTFHNSAEYSSFLDDGWSDQAPSGMTSPALDELDSLVEPYLS